MKTFEERYTAWIDGQLTGEALTAFEQELAYRAEAGDANAAGADKASALELRALLREHLQAPTLTNSEFFNHQMQERIEAEISKAARRREAAVKPTWKFPAFAWPFARLAGAGAACLFVAGALYYGMVPSHGPDAGKSVAKNSPPQQTNNVATTDSPVLPTQGLSADRPKDKTLALLGPTPTPVDLTSNEDIQVAPSKPGSTTSATSLRYEKANVIWTTGLPYLPNISDTNTTPTPAPSAAPSIVP